MIESHFTGWLVHLANGLVAALALGWCGGMFAWAFVAGSGPGMAATAVLFGVVTYVAKSHVKNVRNVRTQLVAWQDGVTYQPAPVRAQVRPVPSRPVVEPAPERPALPPVPLVVVFGDWVWQNQDMGDDMIKAALRVARNYGELDTVRELTAARRVVKGELAS